MNPDLRLPTEIERELMRRLAITFQDGVFRWRGYRYDLLNDAAAVASLSDAATGIAPRR